MVMSTRWKMIGHEVREEAGNRPAVVYLRKRILSRAVPHLMGFTGSCRLCVQNRPWRQW